MKRIILLAALLLPLILDASGVRVLQAEYIRGGKWQPDYAQFKGVTFIQGTPNQAKAFPGVSQHATEVTRILLAGPVKPESITICEAVTFTGASRGNIVGLNGSTLTDSLPASWDLENHSWGGSDALSENPRTLDVITVVDGKRVETATEFPGILKKFVQRVERDNVLSFVALPNPGDKATFRLLSACPPSPNVIKVASSISGYIGGVGMVPDVYAPVQYNSYATPTEAQTGIAMIDWCKEHAPQYRAADLGWIIRETAVKDDKGRPIISHSAAMAALERFYSPAVPTPPPTQQKPVVTNPVAATANVGQSVTFSVTADGTAPLSFGWARSHPEIEGDRGYLEIPGADSPTLTIPSVKAEDAGEYVAIVANAAGLTSSAPATLTVNAAPTPKPTVPPVVVVVPMPTPTPTPKPSSYAIKSFGRSVAWPPTVVSWDATGASKVTLTDPEGKTREVAAKASLTATEATKKSVWILTAEYPDGSIQQATTQARAALGEQP
jgi:hypothetical protein